MKFAATGSIVALAALSLGLLVAPSTPASAQGSSSPFCPAVAGLNMNLINGYCVAIPASGIPFTAKPDCPAQFGPVSFGSGFACAGFSNSGASQQTITTTANVLAAESVSTTLDAIRARREEETRRCPDGSLRAANRDCRPGGATRAIGYAQEEGYASYAAGRMVVKAPPAVGVAGLSTVSPALWIQAFGDREKRTEIVSGLPAGAILPPNAANGVPGLSTSSDQSRTTTTGGFIAGMDFTFRNVTSNADALVVGLLGGYTSTGVKFNANSNTQDVDGPSVGLMAAYAIGNFTTDATVKADFMTQKSQFSDFLGTAFAVTGTTSIRFTNYSFAANATYRIPLTGTYYMEPTGGIIYTRTDFEANTALNLVDSTATRLQGGVRFGNDWVWGTTRVNTTLTGLAYDTVKITGVGAIQNGAATAPTDEGKLFGQFLLASVFDFGSGFSATAAGDVRFATDVVGIGVKGGLRYQW